MNKYIYIAGPMTIGHTDVHIHNAIKVAEKIIEAGGVPFVPQMSFLWGMVTPHDTEWWLKYDEAWLEKCDALYRIPGDSKGADREVFKMGLLNRPVFTDLNEVIKWLKGSTKETIYHVKIAVKCECGHENKIGVVSTYGSFPCPKCGRIITFDLYDQKTRFRFHPETAQG